MDLLLTQPNAPLMPSDPMFLIQGIRELPCECAAILDAGQSRVLRPHHVHLTEGAVGVEEPVEYIRCVRVDTSDLSRVIDTQSACSGSQWKVQGSEGPTVQEEPVGVERRILPDAQAVGRKDEKRRRKEAMPDDKQKALSAETEEVFPKRRRDLRQGRRRMVYFNARMAGYSKDESRRQAVEA